MDPSAEGDVIFHNAVGSGQVVSAAASKGRTVFASDVNATRVTLRNCFVGGCVYGDEIILDHCVVLGGAFATKSLSVNHSIVGTFNSQSVSIEGLNYLLYPSAFSVEPVEAASTAELYNLTAPTGKPVGFWWIGLHHVRTPFSGFGTRAAAQST